MAREVRAWVGTVASGLSAIGMWHIHQRLLEKVEGAAPDRFTGNGILAFATATLIAFLTLSAFRVWRLRRIEDTPRSRVRSMSVGPVELEGRAGRAELIAPFSQRACVYYAFNVSHGGEELGRQDSSRFPIRFEDETGSAWIDADGAEIRASRTTRFGEALSMGRFGPDALAHLDSLGVRPWQPVSIVETVIEPGAPLLLHAFYDSGRTSYDRASSPARSESHRLLRPDLDLETDPIVGRDPAGCSPFFVYAKRQRVLLGCERDIWLARLRIGAAYAVAAALLGGAFAGEVFWLRLIGYTAFTISIGAALVFGVQTRRGKKVLGSV